MKVVVTGGAGFLGSHLCEKLLNDGNEVICLDNYFTGSKKNIVHLLDNPYFEVVRHDVIAPYFVEVEKLFNEIIDNGQVEINAEHLAYLIQWNNVYKLIYCTNLKLDRMNNLLTRLNLNIEVTHLISTKQVLNAKPEGDIYLKVARLLNIKANTITVIDSTLNGIQAAYLANTKGLYLAQFIEANSTIKKFAYAHFKQSQDLHHYVLNLINQSE